MNILETKKNIIIAVLQLKAGKCGDFLELWVYSHKVNETLDLKMSDDHLTECAKYVQKWADLPDLV